MAMRRGDRTLVKWLHWLAFGLILYFVLVEPEVPSGPAGRAKTAALATHAGMGLLLAVVTLLWAGLYAWRGPLGRPGPKLGPLARRAHRIVNTGLYWGLPIMVATGAVAGLAARFPVLAFGLVPLNLAEAGPHGLHRIATEVHEIAFDAILVLIVAHAGFHIWRHLWLGDNALRIMAPRALHRFL